MKEEKIDLGAVRIHGKVIASIASIATLEVDGVKKIYHGLSENLFNFVRQRPSFSGIRVIIEKNNEIKLHVPVVVKYGVNIPEVATRIQDSVRTAIDKMTDLSLRDINVDVQGIERG